MTTQRSIAKHLIAVTMTSVALTAAEPEVGGPSLGFLYDADARTVRSINGIPGSALAGNVRTFEAAGVELLSAAAPRREYALALAAGKVVRLDLRTGRALELPSIEPHRPVWSPSGSALVTRTTDGKALVTKRVDTEAAVLAYTVSTASDDEVLAVSDDSDRMLLRRAGGELYVATASGETAPVLLSVSFAAFMHESNDAAAVTPSGAIYLLRGATEPSALAELPGANAVAFSADNSRVVVASESLRSIASVKVSDGTVTRSECPCSPKFLRALHSPSLFQVTAGGDSPVWLFRADSTETPFSFVPQVSRMEAATASEVR